MRQLESWASRGLSFTLSAVIVVAGEGTGWARTLRVPGEFNTINKALSASVSGDTVLVAPGTYSDIETRDYPVSTFTACAFLVSGVVLASEEGPEATTIDMMGQTGPGGEHVVVAVLGDEEMVLDGFTVTGTPVNHPGIFSDSTEKLVIRNCIIRDLDAGEVGGGGIRASFIDLDVIGCQFLRCRGETGAGIKSFECVTRVEDSYFEDCTMTAIQHRADSIEYHEEDLRVIGCRFVRNLEGSAVFIGLTTGDVLISGCWFEGNTCVSSGGAVILGGYTGGRNIENSVFWNNETTGIVTSGGAVSVGSVSATIRGNTFYGNRQTWEFGGGAAIVLGPLLHTLENNIIANSEIGPAIRVYPGGSVATSCNVFWMNPDGIGDNYLPGPTDFEADPFFCDPESGDFRLSGDSPCLPENSDDCGLIGARGFGCGSVSVEDESWGQIKGRFRPREEGTP